MKFQVTRVVLTIVLAIAVSPSDAAIMTVNSQGSASPAGAASSFTLSSFDPMGGSKLIFAVSSEGAGGNRTIDSVTFGGAALTEAETTDPGEVRQAAIYYLDNPTNAAADIVVTFSGNTNGIGLGAISVTGAAAGGPSDSAIGVDADTGAASASIDVTASLGGIVVAATSIQDGGGVTYNTSGGGTALYGGPMSSSSGAAGFAIAGAAGTLTSTFDGGINRGNRVLAAATWEMIPEPSAIGLMIVGLLTYVPRRSK